MEDPSEGTELTASAEMTTFSSRLQFSTARRQVIIFVVLAVVVNLAGAPFFVAKSGVWRYPFIKKYVSEIYHPVRMPAWVPNKLPESSSKCSILYLPSVMQGSGYFSVCFACSTNIAEEWADFGEKNAKYIVPLTDYNNARELSHMGEGRYLDFLPAGYETDPKYAVSTTAGDTEQRSVDIVLDNSFWYGDEEGTMIYIMETNLSVDKPYNEIIIANKEKGLVQLFSE